MNHRLTGIRLEQTMNHPLWINFSLSVHFLILVTEQTTSAQRSSKQTINQRRS